ncbi:MAG: hypothetical protein AAGJ35_12790, partial [Myxococcota bacterium]
MSLQPPREITPKLYVVETPQRFWGLEVGARMTILRLEGGLLLHSPVRIDASLLEPLGILRWALAPNRLHHLYMGPWIDAGLEAWAAPGLPAKRPDLKFHAVVGQDPHPFGEEVALFP